MSARDAIRAREQRKLHPEPEPKAVKARVRKAAEKEAEHVEDVREEAAEQGGLGRVTTEDLPVG